MPELEDRDSVEAGIVAELEPVFERQYKVALASPSNIPYAQFQSDLAAVMARELEDVFLAAGAALLIGNAVVLTQGLFENAAKQWSSQFASTLASEVVNTSRQLANDAVFNARGDKQKIAEGLATIFMSADRLSNIAITETTRTTSAAEHYAVAFIGRDESKPKLIPVWRTRRDDAVCEHCKPLAGHSKEVWGEVYPMGPPGHVRCRCWLDWIPAAQWARRSA